MTINGEKSKIQKKDRELEELIPFILTIAK